MTLKTYIYQEVAGHGEITEWVPADVALEMFNELSYALAIADVGLPLGDDWKASTRNVLAKAVEK